MSENYPPGWKLKARSWKDKPPQEITDPIRKNMDRIVLAIGLIAATPIVCVGIYGLYKSFNH